MTVTWTLEPGGAAEIQSKIDAIRNDSKHPHNDQSHADHKRAVEDMTKLYSQLDEAAKRGVKKQD